MIKLKHTINIQDFKEELLARLKRHEFHIEVGYFPETSPWHEGYGTASIYEVAFWQEYGTPTQPPRPFMQQTVENHRHTLKMVINLHLKLALMDPTERSPVGGLAKAIGEQWKEWIQETLDQADSYFPALADATKAYKEGTMLIETKQMKEGIQMRHIGGIPL
jgi:hypothetical protein